MGRSPQRTPPGLENVAPVDIGGSEVPVLKARVAGHHVYQRAGIYDVQVQFVVTCLTASEEPYDFHATGVPLATVRVGG
jgi:hypothetical protein